MTVVEPQPPAARDLPQQTQHTPGWSESYFSQAYSPASEVGLYLRLVRCPFDPDLWCEVFLAYLPDDRFLVAKSFGYRQSGSGPAANALSFECNKPFDRWTKRFKGAARLVAGRDLRAGALGDGPYVAVELEAMYTARTPVVAASLGEQFWAHGHYEQHAEVEGSITYDRRQLEIRGTGLRDHSVGPRDLSGMANHLWVVAQFPDSGRTVMAMYVVSDGGALNHASIGGGAEGPRGATLQEPPLIEVGDDIEAPFPLRLSTGPGTSPVIIAGQPLQTGALSIIGPNEWMLGTHPDAHHLLMESMVRLEWDGEIGWGYMERSILTGRGAEG